MDISLGKFGITILDSLGDEWPHILHFDIPASLDPRLHGIQVARGRGREKAVSGARLVSRENVERELHLFSLIQFGKIDSQAVLH